MSFEPDVFAFFNGGGVAKSEGAPTLILSAGIDLKYVYFGACYSGSLAREDGAL